MLTHEPHWESHGHRFRGLTQLDFLKAVPRDLLTPTASRKMGELERRFPDYRFAPPVGIVASTVGPPIEQSAIAKMSDRDWLGAMRKYNDHFRQTSRSNPFVGGVSQLAGALLNEAKEDPERFYRLSFSFDRTISLKYIQATISALADSAKAPSTWLFDVIRRFSNRITEEARQGICWALNHQRAKDDVPDDLLDLVSTWGLEDPDPSEERDGKSGGQKSG